MQAQPGLVKMNLLVCLFKREENSPVSSSQISPTVPFAEVGSRIQGMTVRSQGEFFPVGIHPGSAGTARAPCLSLFPSHFSNRSTQPHPSLAGSLLLHPLPLRGLLIQVPAGLSI